MLLLQDLVNLNDYSDEEIGYIIDEVGERISMYNTNRFKNSQSIENLNWIKDEIKYCVDKINLSKNGILISSL